MSLLTAVLGTLGVAGVSRLTQPKMPRARAFEFDFDEATKDALAARKKAQDPQLLAAYEQQRQNALSLSRGELPPEIEAAVRRDMYESAALRGLSPDQGARLTTQAVGLARLEAMERGHEITRTLEAIERNEWAAATDSALSRANMLYSNYAAEEQRRLAKWESRAKSHKELFSGLASLVSTAALKGEPKSPPSPEMTPALPPLSPAMTPALPPLSPARPVWQLSEPNPWGQ